MSEFRQRTINGITWSVVSRLGRMALMFVISVILARLLSPREFGLVAMITVITSFAAIFAELGFSAALVQKQDIQQEQLSSVFWLNVGAGLLLTLVFAAGAPLISRFYREPMLTPLTIFISTSFLISSLNIVQNTLLTKALDFRTLSIVELSAVLVAGIISIAMALAGFGAWSLAAQSVLISAVTAVLLWILSDWRPSLLFRWTAVKALLGFSMSLFGTKVLNYWVRNIDYLLIGRFLGSDPLGVYSRAYDVMLFPLASVSRVLSRVMFPSMSIIQENKPRVANLYLRMTRTIALITFPMMLGLFVTVEPFVLVVFGPQWIGMIPVLRILSLVGMTQSIGTLNGNLYLSQGRADLQLKVGLVLKTNAILGIVIGLQWGIVGVAVGYAIASFINSYPSFYFAGRLVHLTFRELLRNLAGVFGCAAAMALLVWAAGMLLPAAWSQSARLAAQVLLGVIVYVSLVHLLKVQAYKEARALISEQWQLRGGRIISLGTRS
jgi:O-antigen/teichoic acid export membrane protein